MSSTTGRNTSKGSEEVSVVGEETKTGSKRGLRTIGVPTTIRRRTEKGDDLSLRESRWIVSRP